MDFSLNLSSGLFANDQKFKTFEQGHVYDLIIIGGGPAGLTAAVYAMRKGLSTGLITRNVGGQVADTAGIENYLGYRYIDGSELVDKFREQVLQFSIAFESDSTVQSLTPGQPIQITLEDGRILKARSLIIASGKQSKKLGIPGEDKLVGHGVAYCAICDAPFFVDQRVVVVGGGNSGVEAAIDLAKVARHVTLIQRRDHLTADQIVIDKLKAYENVDYLFEHIVTEIRGDQHVSSVMVQNRQTGEVHEMMTDGIFVQIGLIPNSAFAKNVLDMNEYNEIVIDESCRTSEPGIFAAGDVTTTRYKQIIIASGEGATAALSAADFLLNQPS
ncbi:MAG: FAD-dependent oxidoreductase [Eubacteriales bacterium]|nr:FAD-dependent oxidoreductase [Eubacteriales bacterium]